MTQPTTAGRLPVCGEQELLPPELMPKALELAPWGTAQCDDVQRDLHCTLQRHEGGDHYAFVMEIDGPQTGSVWTHWAAGARPAEVVVLPDCPVGDEATGEPCCGFAAHPGAHTFRLTDPWAGVEWSDHEE